MSDKTYSQFSRDLCYISKNFNIFYWEQKNVEEVFANLRFFKHVLQNSGIVDKL